MTVHDRDPRGRMKDYPARALRCECASHGLEVHVSKLFLATLRLQKNILRKDPTALETSETLSSEE